jgi:plastocyanin
MGSTNQFALAGALGLAAGLGIAWQVSAGGDKVVFPDGFEKHTLYSVVDRYDTKQYRELYATPATVEAVRRGEPIPSGTVLTMVVSKAQADAQGNPLKDGNGRFLKGDLAFIAVMEKRTGWGTEYPADLRNGEWEYQMFTADRKVNDKANLTACFQCHKPHEGQDYVISLASLRGTQPGQMAAPAAGAGVVSIANFLFGPEKVMAEKGKAITFVNTDGSPHQVTVKGGPRTPIMLKGQSQTVTLNDAGTFEYICGLHPSMKGTIEVR